MNHVRVWLVSSALDSVEGRVWTAHTGIKSRGCQRFPLRSALWLVGDSAAVSLRCVWTRDQMMRFFFGVSKFQVVLQLSHPPYPVFSWLHVHSWTSAHLKPWTAQDAITLLQFTFMSHRS